MKTLIRLLFGMIFLSVFNTNSFAAGVLGDFNGDSRIDLQDAIYSLQVTSGLRTSPLGEGFDALARKAIQEAFSAAQHFFIHEDPSGTVTYPDLIEHGYNPDAFPDVTVTIADGSKGNLLIKTHHNSGNELYMIRISGITEIHEIEKLAERTAVNAFQAAQKYFATGRDGVDITILGEYGLIVPANVVLLIPSGMSATLLIRAFNMYGYHVYTVDHNGLLTVSQPH